MKKQSPEKHFLIVEEREEEILSRVDPGVRGKLKELVDEFKDMFPDTLPKGRPPKRDIVHEIYTKEGVKPLSRDVPQRQRVSTATAVLTERERPLHPFPLQLLLGAVAAAVN